MGMFVMVRVGRKLQKGGRPCQNQAISAWHWLARRYTRGLSRQAGSTGGGRRLLKRRAAQLGSRDAQTGIFLTFISLCWPGKQAGTWTCHAKATGQAVSPSTGLSFGGAGSSAGELHQLEELGG